MLHEFANNQGYVGLKQAAEDREGWRHREMSITCSILQKSTTDDDDDASCQTG